MLALETDEKFEAIVLAMSCAVRRVQPETISGTRVRWHFPDMSCTDLQKASEPVERDRMETNPEKMCVSLPYSALSPSTEAFECNEVRLCGVFGSVGALSPGYEWHVYIFSVHHGTASQR